MTRKSASITLVLLGTAGAFLGCADVANNNRPTSTDTSRTGYRYRSHSVIFIPMSGGSHVGGGRMGAGAGFVSPGRSGFGRSGTIGG
jgi:hypothetical protein